MDRSREMTEVLKTKLQTLGFTNLRIRKNKINFSISNQGQSTDENWKFFLVNIETIQDHFKISLYFNYNNTVFAFKKDLQAISAEAILLINNKLPIGQFKMNSSKHTISLKLSAVYSCISRPWWENLAHEYIRMALVLYKSFAYAFVKIIGGVTDLPMLIKECVKRSNGNVSESKSSSTDSDDPDDSCYSSSDKGNQELLTRLENSSFFKERIAVIKKIEIPGLVSGLEYGKNENCFDRFLDFVKEMFLLKVKFCGIKFNKIFIQASEDQIIRVYLTKYRYFEDISNKEDSLEDYINTLISNYNKELADSYLYNPSFLIKKYSVHIIDKSAFKIKDLRLSDNIVGQGGFGIIYRNFLYNVPVAIKFMKSDSSEGKKILKLITEYKIMQTLDHSNIIKTFGFVEHKEKFGIVMEMCGGGPLSTYIKQNLSISMKTKLEIMLKVIKAIEYMHIKNFCHFDIKPQNIILDDNLNPMITDLGLSQMITEKQMKKTGFTMIYSSPEQIKGVKLGPKADVWSFGMTMYNTFTGITPFDYLQNEPGKKLEKSQFYNEIYNNKRTPKISEMFEIQYPQIVKLLRETWKTEINLRASSKQVRMSLTEILRGFD